MTRFTLALEIEMEGVAATTERDDLAWALSILSLRTLNWDAGLGLAEARRSGDVLATLYSLRHAAMCAAITAAAERELERLNYTDDPSTPEGPLVDRIKAWMVEHPWTDTDERRHRLNEADARAEKLLAWARMAGDRGLEEAAAAACAEADLLDGVIHVSVACDLIAERRGP